MKAKVEQSHHEGVDSSAKAPTSEEGHPKKGDDFQRCCWCYLDAGDVNAQDDDGVGGDDSGLSAQNRQLK